jgi:hypothetical protein
MKEKALGGRIQQARSNEFPREVLVCLRDRSTERIYVVPLEFDVVRRLRIRRLISPIGMDLVLS